MQMCVNRILFPSTKGSLCPPIRQRIGPKQPPLVGTDISAASFNAGNTYPSTYDTLGRRYAVSARVRF